MKIYFSLMLVFLSGLLLGQDATSAAAPAGGEHGLDINIILVLLAVFLLVPISSLGKAFVGAAKMKLEAKSKSASLKVLIPLGLLLLSQVVQAQASTSASVANGNLVNSHTMTITLLCVIALEIFIMVFLAYRVADIVHAGDHAHASSRDSALLNRIKRMWSRLNFRPMEEEADIDMGHDYDGIRELDNVIPPWFTTAFLLTILVAAGYLYRYHIAKSAPMQIEEYQIELAKADLEHDTYLETQASSIDENNVTIMSAADIEAGKSTFTSICAACHRADGGGQVGPNLTDEYWIHGGGIQNVFKTIKYGVPDKGMISWKAQLSPTQIAQVANYVLSLAGSNPTDPKEKQGTLYVPEHVKADSTSVPVTVKDSTAMK